MKTQNKKWGQEKKVWCQDGKMCKKFHCVCFYSTVNDFLVGPLKWQRLQNLSLIVARFPTEVWILSEVVKYISCPVVLFQNGSSKFTRSLLKKLHPDHLAVILTGIGSTWRWTLDQFSVTSLPQSTYLMKIDPKAIYYQ